MAMATMTTKATKTAKAIAPRLRRENGRLQYPRSKADPESGLFYKGEHRKCFAYKGTRCATIRLADKAKNRDTAHPEREHRTGGRSPEHTAEESGLFRKKPSHREGLCRRERETCDALHTIPRDCRSHQVSQAQVRHAQTLKIRTVAPLILLLFL